MLLGLGSTPSLGQVSCNKQEKKCFKKVQHLLIKEAPEESVLTKKHLYNHYYINIALIASSYQPSSRETLP